ncbi:MAG: hypothetical protein QF819_01330 [Gemmatimonadota bacterium]|jgi:hypothetical protein|nr:hypothetical protein [Gemmatimonadota bacterium]MDP6460632.1 hypothetical protein [Gemmatimonadota bacterium]MDP6529544.1 hypothetical protein [Gemmatimonadota bacterium]MDP6801810.1 hypothetical protein [Gemmatimonadota bacterium]MDP7032551.1 hypothetical protein [Gemmatimonadota bacterium]
MKTHTSQKLITRIPACLVVLLVLSGTAASAPATPHVVVGARDLRTNDSYIAGLYTNLDLENPKEVFGYVFEQLSEEVMVYPSEGYFYFEFPSRGLTVSGCITFYVRDRAEGKLGFGYVGRMAGTGPEPPSFPIGESHDFTKADGMEMKAETEFLYRVRYEGRTVRFRLYDPGMDPPVKAKLREDEIFVGPTFDESGLRFHLVFNETMQRLFWVLNEDGFVPEVMTVHSEHVALGQRTGFAFYLDAENHRKILVGVQGDNVRHNNWHDGPFDQLPDSYVKTGETEIEPYLRAHYHLDPGEIDRYGNYTTIPGSRVPVAPYRAYYDTAELSFVEEAVTEGLKGPELYARITKQVYNRRPEAPGEAAGHTVVASFVQATE